MFFFMIWLIKILVLFCKDFVFIFLNLISLLIFDGIGLVIVDFVILIKWFWLWNLFFVKYWVVDIGNSGILVIVLFCEIFWVMFVSCVGFCVVFKNVFLLIFFKVLIWIFNVCLEVLCKLFIFLRILLKVNDEFSEFDVLEIIWFNLEEKCLDSFLCLCWFVWYFFFVGFILVILCLVK